MYQQGQVVDYMAEINVAGEVIRMVQYAIREDNGSFLEAECPKTGRIMTLLRDCICTPEEDEPRHFYVSVKDRERERTGILLGPYATWEEAEKQKERARGFAMDNDDHACWYSYGICSSPLSVVIKTVFGV